jgi:hypothetical protein
MMKADTPPPPPAFPASDQLIKRKKLINVTFYLFFLEFFRSAEAVDMNGRFQMQGGKNWILPK